MVRRGLARLGHLARRAVLRLRDPGRDGQVLLRLARRADRLPRRACCNYCRRHGPRLRPLLEARTATPRCYHFIGKDIVYFHTLFWPAVLHGAGFRAADVGVRARLPDRQRREDVEVARHASSRRARGSSTCPPNTCATSTRRGSGSGVDDLDLNLDDFVAKVNSDIVGKLVNIASRCAGFIARGSAAGWRHNCPTWRCYDEFIAARASASRRLRQRDLAAAVREIMALTDKANLYIDQQKPWLMAKDPARAAEVQEVCTQGLNLFRVLALYLKPVMPRLAAGAEKFLGLPDQTLGGRAALCCSAPRSQPTSRWRRVSTPPPRRRCSVHPAESLKPTERAAGTRAATAQASAATAPPAAARSGEAGALRRVATAGAPLSIDEFATRRPAHRTHRFRANSSTAPTSC